MATNRFRLSRWYNWLFYRIVNPHIERCLKTHASGRMLDIGCGEKPYAEFAAPYVTEHVGLDHDETCHDRSRIDLFGSADNIPVEANAFDTVLCTDTLEHLENPAAAMAEAFRILKPGGIAIVTVPFFWHLHEEPRDFFRFTRYGLTHLFETHGFEIIEITSLSGFCAMMAQEWVYFLLRFRQPGRRNPLWWLVPPIAHLIQAAGFLLNKIEHSERFTFEYIAVVRKPDKQI
ncbi:MAG: class I SAM-dependent methyltransferase [Candidatus Omnitrophota bacterium]